MLDPRQRQRRMRTALLAGMTAFVLVTVFLLAYTPAPRDTLESRHRWAYIAQIAVPSGLLTMSLTYLLIRRQG